MGRTTDLLGIGVAERERPRSEQVLTSVVDSTWLENIRSDLRLQSVDQIHVEFEREDSFGGQDNYRTPRVLSTGVAK